MKHKKTISIASLLLVVMLLLGTAITAYAASNFPYNSSHQLTIDTSWKTIASSTTGFNCNVYITADTNQPAGTLQRDKCDIRMLPKSGTNPVWEKTSVFDGEGGDTFWCGPDVYKIQIRTHVGDGRAWAVPVGN